MARTKRQIHLCTKTINGIDFTSHEYRNGKYLITADGYNGERWCGYETWEKRNDGDTTDRRSSFHQENKRWFQSSFTKIIEVPHITELFPMPLLLNAPKEFSLKEYAMNIINEFLNKQNKRDRKRFERVIIGSIKRKGYTDEAYIEAIMMAHGDKKCVKELLKIYHPDKNNGNGNIKLTKLLIEYL